MPAGTDSGCFPEEREMLPIERVVLFKHGVGYFQRTGTVEGDEVIELGFKADQMNDVLKSLTTLDFSGGTFTALSYDSEEPLECRLAELNMNIPEKGAISAFLDRVKGARVSVPLGQKTVEGTVMGIEEVQQIHDGLKVIEPHLAVLAEDGDLVRIPLLEAETVRFLDVSIRRDLETLLGILFSSLRKDLKRLTIQTCGEGEREVSLSYVVEAPVWKTSYRIMLAGGEGEKPLLQGWALVDNTTEDDWKGVSLSLVSGLPISFIHDLYTPRHRRRPVVAVEEEAVVAPPVVEAAMAPEAPCPDQDYEMEDYLDEVGAEQPMMAKASAPSPRPSMRRAARESVEVQTRTQEAGDLFAYEITRPVDVGRSHSALVPIVQTEVDLERVGLYNPEIREKNPMTAFRIKNTTGLVLEGGPVTVFEGDDYVGEAMLDTLRKEEERITPYSVELGIKVLVDREHQQEDFTQISKSGSYIYKHFRRVLITTYKFSSSLDKAVDLFVDHRFQYNDTEDTPDPVEKTEHFWRYKVTAAPKETTSFEVREITHDFESVELTGIVYAAIADLASENLISDEAREQLEAIAERVESIRKIDEEIVKRQSEVEEITEGQERVRENLKSLGNSSEEKKLRSRYVSNLDSEEERIEELQREVADLRRKKEEEEEELERMVEAFEIR